MKKCTKEKFWLLKMTVTSEKDVRILLESEEYEVIEAENGVVGLKLLDETIDLVILDIMMPKLNGLKVCEEIRKTSNVPVLFLTAKSQESDKLLGLMVGGDDYLAKPFSYAELLGRVKALLRRYLSLSKERARTKTKTEKIIEIGRSNSTLHLMKSLRTEIKLKFLIWSTRFLRLMMQQSGQVFFSAQNIYESVWREPYFYTCGNTVMVHIRKLRTKNRA